MKAMIVGCALLWAAEASAAAAQPAPAEAPSPAAQATASEAPAAPAPPAAPPAVAQPEAPPAPPEAVAPSGPVIAYSGSKTTGMLAMTADKAAFAMLGALAMIAEGKRIVAENHIVDPSEGVAHDVAGDLAQMRSGRVAEAPVPLDRSGKLPKPDALAAAASGAAYVVDVESAWSFMYFSADWLHYRVGFSSQMRLVDASTKKLAARVVCNWDSEKQGEPRKTHGELLDDSAAGLKATIGRGAAYCRGEFKTAVEKAMGDKAMSAVAPGGKAGTP